MLVNQRLGALNGADLVGTEILRALWGTSHPLTVVSWDRWSPGRGEDNGSRPVRWLTPPVAPSFPIFGSRKFARRAAAWVLQSALDVGRTHRLRLAPDTVTVVNGFDNVSASLHRMSAGEMPRVLVVHDAPAKYKLQGQPSIEWALEKMRSFSHLIFPSRRVYEEWLNFELVCGRSGMVIPNCCREDRATEVRAEDRCVPRRTLDWPPDRIVVLCLGSLQYRKGQDVLARALRRVVSEVPSVLLAFVGATQAGVVDTFGRSVESEIVNAGLGRHVRFLGPREDALECIYAADILAVPSRSEVMPITILEAMALETPVVASAVGGIPELVEDGQTGCLVPVEDCEGLAAALVMLAKDVGVRRSLASASRERYWSHFSRARFARSYVEAAENLLRGEDWV